LNLLDRSSSVDSRSSIIQEKIVLPRGKLIDETSWGVQPGGVQRIESSSGIYFSPLEFDGKIQVKKMMLLK